MWHDIINGRHKSAPLNSFMCGRFTLRTPTKAIVEVFDLAGAPDLPPRYNIAPTQRGLQFGSIPRREPGILIDSLHEVWISERAKRRVRRE
jgi:putative SOS response-associated peptidase YedK